MEQLLPSDASSLAEFRAGLLSGDVEASPLIAAVHRQPENTLFLIEIAKACIAKGMFHEADHFLSIILANRPLHVVARTLRLILRLNVALAQPDFLAAWHSFKDALDEGSFILARCQVENEEVPCELGQVYFCIARRLYGALIHGQSEVLRTAVLELSGALPSSPEEVRLEVQRLVIDHLRQAQRFFDQGRTISPSGMGNRSLHWALRITALRRLLEADEGAFTLEGWRDGRVMDRHDFFRETAKRLFCGLGWVDELPAPGAPYSDGQQLELFVAFMRAFEQYDNSVMSPSYRATIQFAFAMLVFDFAPQINVGMLKLIIKWLREAESVAAALAEKPQGIRSIVTCCSQIQPASLMLQQVRRAADYLSEHPEALTGDDDRLLEDGRDHKFLLEAFGSECRVDPADLI